MREAVLRDEDLFGADEAFLTSTTREVVPIVQVDDRAIGTGVPGPVTQALLEGFRRQGAGADARSRPSSEPGDSAGLVSRLFRPRTASIGGQAHIRLRSPYGLSIRPTLGQNFAARTNGSGNAACSRE